MSGSRPFTPLPAWARFYFYGLQGLLDEIVFTALFDFFLSPSGNRELKGHSTVFSFFIYGSCSFFVERVYVFLSRRNVPLYVRLPLYLCILYTWEYATGLVLRQFDACSWDYSHHPLNLHGLITLTYVPGWLVLCFLQDVLSRFLLSLNINMAFTIEKAHIS